MNKSLKYGWINVLLLLALAFSSLGSTPANAAMTNTGSCSNAITVTSNADSGAGSLRQAIVDICAGGAITFGNDYAITLTTGGPIIDKNLSIDGTGHTISLDGNNSSSVLGITNGVTVALTGLTIQHGKAINGGGIYNGGTLTITNTTISANSAIASDSNNAYAGGIYNDGTLTVNNSTFSANSATASLGTSAYAGGIQNNGTLTINDSTFSANSANAGGGIVNVGTLTVNNSTFSANSANAGSGIFNAGTLTVNNSTFSGNSANAGQGGGINSDYGTTTLKNTLLANSTLTASSNPSTPDNNCSGTITDGGHNLDTGTTCGFSAANNSLSSSDPKLGALADNGGTTQTFALLSGSAAIDTGDDTVCADAATVNNLDQRGTARPQGLHCDIGAYEYVFPATATPTATSTAPSTATPTPTSTVAATSTATPTSTLEATDTATLTATVEATSTATPTTTITVTPTATETETATPTATVTVTVTRTPAAASTATATATAGAGVDILIGGADKGFTSLAPGNFIARSFDSLVSGPVDVFYSNGASSAAPLGGSPIFASQRVTSGQSYNEVMGIPTGQLSTDYWFPTYDHSFISGSNTNPMRMWVLVGNASTTQAATVNIYIGGVLQAMSPFSVPAGGRVSTRWVGVKGGPVEVVSSNGVKIFASERVFTYPNNAFNEVLGLPANQLTKEYWFQYYDKVSMTNAIQIGNTSASKAANVDIFIGGVKKGSYSIPAHDFITKSYPIVNGPVRVVSTNDVPVVASQIALSGTNNAFDEVMGYPSNQFATEYWFPAYDHSFVPGSNTNPMRMWVSVVNPGAARAASVDIYIAGVKMTGSPFNIPAGGRVTPRWVGVTNGPVRVVSTNGVNILTSERVLTYPNSGFNELMGLPRNRMSSEYWFPYYDSISMSNDILVGRP